MDRERGEETRARGDGGARRTERAKGREAADESGGEKPTTRATSFWAGGGEGKSRFSRVASRRGSPIRAPLPPPPRPLSPSATVWTLASRSGAAGALGRARRFAPPANPARLAANARRAVTTWRNPGAAVADGAVADAMGGFGRPRERRGRASEGVARGRARAVASERVERERGVRREGPPTLGGHRENQPRVNLTLRPPRQCWIVARARKPDRVAVLTLLPATLARVPRKDSRSKSRLVVCDSQFETT